MFWGWRKWKLSLGVKPCCGKPDGVEMKRCLLYFTNDVKKPDIVKYAGWIQKLPWGKHWVWSVKVFHSIGLKCIIKVAWQRFCYSTVSKMSRSAGGSVETFTEIMVLKIKLFFKYNIWAIPHVWYCSTSAWLWFSHRHAATQANSNITWLRKALP